MNKTLDKSDAPRVGLAKEFKVKIKWISKLDFISFIFILSIF